MRRRLKECVERWPGAEIEGDYDPRCCRFPKSCSASVYSEEFVTDEDLEPAEPEVVSPHRSPWRAQDLPVGSIVATEDMVWIKRETKGQPKESPFYETWWMPALTYAIQTTDEAIYQRRGTLGATLLRRGTGR